MNSEQDNHGASMKEYPQSESATGRRGSAKFRSPLALLGALLCVLALAGCFRGYPTPPDLLEGWQYLGSTAVPASVQADIKEYIAKVSEVERWDPRNSYWSYYTKPTGETAVKVYYHAGHVTWELILFYDSQGIRTKAIKRKYATSLQI